MKNSGFQWIGDIPQNWEMRRVKWCFCQKKEKAGIEDPTVLSLARDGIKVRDISTNEGQLAADYTNYNPVEPGDLLLNPMDLYSGDNCNISKISGVISPAYVNLKTINGNIPEFYNYYFKTQYWTMAFFTHGKGVSFENRWTLTNETLRNYPVVLPNPIQQKKIADYLDDKCGKIDQAIEGQKKIIEKLKEYKQSVITEAVTKGLDPNVPMKDSGIEWIGLIPKHWEVRKVKTLTKIISKGTTPTTVGRDTVKDGPVKFIKAENIQNNQIQNEPHIAIDEETNEILKRSQLKLNDILFVIAGATIGKVAIIDNPQILPANTNQAVSFLRLNNPNLSKYLWYYLQSNYIKEKLHVLSVQSAQPNLSMQDLGNFCIPIPELTEQHCIITHLSTQCAKIDLAIQKKEETIEKLAEYKKSLIYECVTGKREVI